MVCVAAALLALTAIGCAGLGRGGEGPAREYEVEDSVIRNPERGLVQFVHMNDPGDVAFVSGLGVSLANARIRLDPFRHCSIDLAFLSQLEAGFARIREAGLKVVLRFQYNIGSGKDPTIDRVLAHIEQLRPLLQRNADVIAVLQAGFIGAWGEWHTSISGLTRREHRNKVLAHLLAALPAHRSIQVRSPIFKWSFAGGPTSPRLAHTSAPLARIGHHNDCVLSSETDKGTFPRPTARDYMTADSRFVPVGGESCTLARPRTDCDNAIDELRRFHYSYLNRAYHPEVIDTWKQQGCFDAIERDLGYRLVLRRAAWPDTARAGSAIRVILRIENLGFAAPFNPRPAFLVVGRGFDRRSIELSGIDVRRWIPGKTHRIVARVDLPADLPAGSHPIALWLPDAAPRLRTRPAYSIRLSNTGTWRADNGTNQLGHIVITE